MMSSVKQEGGAQLLSSRILSRDRSSVANASFTVYYSLGAGTVPFVWETKPGTPKTAVVVPAAAHDDARPPMISPPPSYQSTATKSRSSPPQPSSSLWSSWPSREGWMTKSWLNIRRRLGLSPSPSPSSQQSNEHDHDPWLRSDHGIDDDDGHHRRPRRATVICF